jgi:hypothetical protein
VRVIEIRDWAARVAAALRGAIAAQPQRDASGPAGDMLAVAESVAAAGGLDVDDLRQRQLSAASGSGLLVRVLPFGLASPLDRPRLRREAYRCAAAAGADEGTTLICVAAALVAADLLRFDPVTTALRVRQSLLEDAPMALLDRLCVLDPHSGIADGEADPGVALQLALSVLEWTGCAGVAPALARLGEVGSGDVGTLTGALAGAAAGQCDVPVDMEIGERADRAAWALASLATGAHS